MSDETTADNPTANDAVEGLAQPLPGFVIAWSKEEPERLGELALVPTRDAPWVLGRSSDDGLDRLQFAPQRPGKLGRPRGIKGAGISRRQLLVSREGARLKVKREGRCKTSVNGVLTDQADLSPGDTLLLHGQLLLLCVARPALLPPLRSFPADAWGPFGAPDTLGLIGESPASWQLRERVAFCARSDRHVLVQGPSGSGKELVGRGVHRLSPRAAAPFVARNAATMPEGLIDAELFGNRRDYPNPGMPEREGLIGEADGGTLFLDEIGELPPNLQAHLLRVLDAGEYQRLGDDGPRRADLRLVAATNRAVEELKFDFAARFSLSVETPPLDARREDVPLLLRHLLRQAATSAPDVAAPFLDPQGHPRLSARLVDALLRHDFRLHVRELDRILWLAMAGAHGDRLELSSEVERHLALASPTAPPEGASTPDEASTRAALRQCDGNQAAAAKQLGLSRYAMYRLVKKFDIDPTHA